MKHLKPLVVYGAFPIAVTFNTGARVAGQATKSAVNQAKTPTRIETKSNDSRHFELRNMWKFCSSTIFLMIVLAVVVTLFASLAYGQERTGRVQQGLVNGSQVSQETQEYYGLLTVVSSVGTCSASLLTNDWAISAAHCFGAADLQSPNTVTLTGSWSTN